MQSVLCKLKGIENAQRRYLRPEGLLKLPDMLISPKFWALPSRPVWHFLFYIPIRVLSLSNGIEPNGRNDFSNAMLFAFCNDNGKLVFKIEKVRKRGNAPSLE